MSRRVGANMPFLPTRVPSVASGTTPHDVADPRDRDVQLADVAHHEAAHTVIAALFRYPVGSLALWQDASGRFAGASHIGRWCNGTTATTDEERNMVKAECVINQAGAVGSTLAGTVLLWQIDYHHLQTCALASHYTPRITIDEVDAIARGAFTRATALVTQHETAVRELARSLIAQREQGPGRVRQLRGSRVVQILTANLPQIPGRPIVDAAEPTRCWDAFA